MLTAVVNLFTPLSRSKTFVLYTCQYDVLRCIFSRDLLLYDFSKFPIKKITKNLAVPYYVKESFHVTYTGSHKRLEASVEEEFISNLRNACLRERQYRKYLYIIAGIFLKNVLRLTSYKLISPQQLLNSLPNYLCVLLTLYYLCYQCIIYVMENSPLLIQIFNLFPILRYIC